MKKAWNDIKSFVTVSFIIWYILLTFMGKMTPDYQELTKLIIIFYFGTQAEKVSQYLQGLKNKQTKNEDEIGGLG